MASPPFCRPRSYSRERDDYYARRDHHREREREGDRYRSERDRYYRERSRSPRTRDRERAEREKYYEVRMQNIVDHRLRGFRLFTSVSLRRRAHATFTVICHRGSGGKRSKCGFCSLTLLCFLFYLLLCYSHCISCARPCGDFS